MRYRTVKIGDVLHFKFSDVERKVIRIKNDLVYVDAPDGWPDCLTIEGLSNLLNRGVVSILN